jgi:aryl-alcohol dehydrogenase-like predicted oxidoreductase
VDHIDTAGFYGRGTVWANELIRTALAPTGLLAECEEAGIAYVPYFPLGGGGNPLDAVRLGKVAARLGVTTAQVQLALLLATSPSMLAIPGTGSLDHLEENLAANGLVLSDQDVTDLRS